MTKIQILEGEVELCRNCGGAVELMCQKGTGICCGNCDKELNGQPFENTSAGNLEASAASHWTTRSNPVVSGQNFFLTGGTDEQEGS